MKMIFEYLATAGSFLYENHSCRIFDSEYIPIFNGCGTLCMRKDNLELKISVDRTQLEIDFRAVGKTSDSDWYSIDILRTYLTGEIVDKSSLDRDNNDFLQAHFDAIVSAFSVTNYAVTESACKELEKQRAKRIFG